MVSEERLGFGSFASSNIAQRLSNAIVEWTLERFDELESDALQRLGEEGAAWRAYVTQRSQLESTCKKLRPKRRGRATPDCTQTRLATLHMYTDDPIAISVGVARTMRLLRAWREVTGSMRLVMAGPTKRQLGGGVEWIGVTIVAAIALILISRDKLVRARDALKRTLKGQITLGEYRALMGLLEHLRFVAQLSAETTNALYRPHGATGESQDGPGARVHPSDIMIEKLQSWLDVVMTCAGALTTIVFAWNVGELIKAARVIIMTTSDAAGNGRGTPGIGGYAHGLFWRVPLCSSLLRLAHITSWETLACAINTLFADRVGGEEVTICTKADALLTPSVLTQHKSQSEDAQAILHHLHTMPGYTDIQRRTTAQHISGDGNIMADAVSRGLWEELTQLCDALRVRPLY